MCSNEKYLCPRDIKLTNTCLLKHEFNENIIDKINNIVESAYCMHM